MSDKQPRRSRHSHHRHSLPNTISSHARRGRSRSRSALGSTHSSAQLPSRNPSCSRPRTHQRVNQRDIPVYFSSDAPDAYAIPRVFAEALREQGPARNGGLTNSSLGTRLPTPPLEPDTQEAQRHSTPNLKRRPSLSPTATTIRRRRRRRPQPQQQSVSTTRDEPISPPQPEFIPLYAPRPASPPYSIFSIIRSKSEKKKREKENQWKRESWKSERRRETDYGRRRGDDFDSRKPNMHDSGISESDDAIRQRVSPVREAPQCDDSADVADTGSRGERRRRRFHGFGRRRRKKHRRRSGEQQHRRQKRRSRFSIRCFFSSLGRKLGKVLRLLPASVPSSPEPQPTAQYSSPNDGNWSSSAGRDPVPTENQYRKSQSMWEADSRWGRKSPLHPPSPPPESTTPPFFYVYRSGSPVGSWNSKLSRARRRRSAPVPISPTFSSPRMPSTTKRSSWDGYNNGERFRKLSHHSSSSTISIIARKVMGPFLSDSSGAAASPRSDGGFRHGNMSWRNQKLLTAGSRPATPPSSRTPSPKPRGRSGSRRPEFAVPVPFQPPSVSSMGIRKLYPASQSSAERTRSGSVTPRQMSSPEYGLTGLFATPSGVSSPNSSLTTTVRLPSVDSGTRRLVASPPMSTTGSNFGLRHLFG